VTEANRAERLSLVYASGPRPGRSQTHPRRPAPRFDPGTELLFPSYGPYGPGQPAPSFKLTLTLGTDPNRVRPSDDMTGSFILGE